MKGIYFFYSILMLLFVSCSNKGEKNYKEYSKTGIIHVENERSESVAEFNYSIEKVFEVKNNDSDTSFVLSFPGDRYGIAVDLDKNQNLFIADFKRKKVLKFNNSGEFVMSFGNRGSGPGEFPAAPIGLAIVEDSIYVAGANGRITVFDLDGKFSRYSETGKRIFNITGTIKGLVVMVEDYEGRWKSDDFKMGFCLYNLTEKLKLKNKIYGDLKPFSLENIDSDDQGINYFCDYNSGMITVAGNSKKEYRLFKYDYSGKLLKKIKKKYNPLKRSKEMMANYEQVLSDFTKKSGNMFKFKKISQYRNVIDQIFQDTGKNSWVSVNESKLSNKPQVFDIFDENGYFLKRIFCKELAGVDLISRNEFIISTTPKEINYRESGMADLVIKVMKIKSDKHLE